MFKSAGQSSVDCPALLFSVYFHLVFIPINLFSPCVPSPMSILICPVTCYSLASRSFWTFLLLFSALCPFSPARFRISLWLPENFGLINCFSVLYVHFLLPDSVFLSGFRRILDFFPVFLGFMSIFSCLVPCYSLASCSFWTFLLLFCALCPFSPARFRIFSGFRMFLDFFTAFLCFMSIFSCPVPYFSLASGCFWTFLLFFSALCPFSPARFRISLWLHVLFELFYCFSVLYVHFLLLGSVFLSGFRRILDFFPAFSRLYVHFLPPGSVFPSGFRMFLDFFTAFLGFMSIFLVAFTPVSVFLSGFRRILDFFLLFLCFMSILTGSVPYFPLASGCLWTFLLLFSALCPFSPAQFSVSL